MRSTAPMLLVGGVAMAVLVGCGSGTGGSTSSATPSGLAPPITLDQLSVGRYADRPCDMLRADRQVARGLVPPGTVTHPASGPAVCAWSSTLKARPRFTAGVDVTKGLEQRYRDRASIGFFEPTDISSYPALHTTPDPDGDKHGHCTTEVGVADRALLLVSVDYGSAGGSDAADPCADADALALAIMGQLKESGG